MVCNIEPAPAVTQAAAKATWHHAKTGRSAEALQRILEAESALFDAQKITTPAYHLNRVRRCPEEKDRQVGRRHNGSKWSFVDS